MGVSGWWLVGGDPQDYNVYLQPFSISALGVRTGLDNMFSFSCIEKKSRCYVALSLDIDTFQSIINL